MTPRAVMGGAMLAGFALRLLFSLGYWTGQPLTHDEREYLDLARSVASGRGFAYEELAGPDEPQRFGRAPAYPVFVAAVMHVSGSSWRVEHAPAAVKVAQSGVGAAGVWLVGMLASRAAGPWAGAMASIAAAVYPPLVWISGYVLSEALFSPLALASALLLSTAIDPPRTASPRATTFVFLSGLVGGVASLTRPAMVAFLLFGGLWLLSHRRVHWAFMFAAGAILVIAPWTVRNARVHDRFVLIASEGGVTFWTGNHPLARGDGDMAASPDIKRANLVLRARHADLTPEELEPVYYREAFQYIRQRPLSWVGLLARKAFFLAVPVGPSYMLHSRLYRAASWMSYACILPLAVLGLATLRREKLPAQAMWLLASSAIVVQLVFFPAERFRIPVLDPTLIVLAAVWLTRSAAISRLSKAAA